MNRILNKQASHLILKIFITATFCWLCLYSTFHSYSPQLETSWMYAINAARSQGFIFGTDILFTYGPLGYLFVPFPMDGHIGHAAGIQLFLLLTWFALITRISINGLSLVRLLTAVILMVFVQQGLTSLWLMATAALSCHIVIANNKESLFSSVLCTLLVVFSMLTKFSLGIATAGALGAALVIRSVTNGASSRTTWATAIITSIIALLFIAFHFFSGIGHFFTWLHGVLEITKGYSSAMHIAGPAQQVVIAFVCLAAFLLTLTANLFNREKQDKYIALVMLLPIFLSFKLGFVRQDGHVMIFFSSFSLLICTLLLFVRSSQAFTKTLPLAIVSIMAYSFAGADFQWLPTKEKLLGVESTAIAKKMIHLQDSVRTVNETFTNNLAAEKITAPIIREHISPTTPVDSIPWDTSVIPANDFTWRPAPVFQFYSAYTMPLDALNADHYAGERGADVLLCRFRSIDIRHMLWDTPQTWRSILNHYEWAADIPDNEMVIMTRREKPITNVLENIERSTLSSNELISIPQTNQRLYVDIPLDYSTVGFVKKTLFRLPPLYLLINYDDGTFGHWKITPDTVGSGILINCVPQNLEDFRQFLMGSSPKRAVSFMIHGPGTGHFKWPIELTWKTDGSPLSFGADNSRTN